MDRETYNKLLTSDARAWELFYNQVIALVRCWVNMRLRPYTTESKENVVQSVFLNIHKGFPTYNPELQLEPWLFVITKNACADWYNNTYQETMHLNMDTAPAPDIIDLIDITDSFSRLKIEHIQTLDMILDGLTTRQMSIVTQVPINTMYSRIHRMRKELKKILDENDR